MALITQEIELREQICSVGKELHRSQLVDGTAGNISVRLDDNRFLITPSGLRKGYMKPNQLIVIDKNGTVLESSDNTKRKPSSETPMHLEVYKHRPDVHAVIHAHPTYAVALTIAGIPMQKYTIPEAIILLGIVPTAPYATPATTEDSEVITDLIENHDALLLSHHGSLTVGKDVWEALVRLETLEHNARLTYLVHQLGGGTSLTSEQIEKLLDLRQKLGLTHPGELERALV
ncbi:MAG: class II aldolase/adducin family protein [Anaerolineae bacterium]